MNVIYALEHPAASPEVSMFLAGPSPRGNDDLNWRPEALELLERIGFMGTVYVPLPRDGVYADDFDHEAQIDWELQYLEAAGTIAFWMPRHVETLPGFTSNVEFGLFARSGTVVLGYPPDAHKMKYLEHVAQKFSIPTRRNLKDTILCAIFLAYANADDGRS